VETTGTASRTAPTTRASILLDISTRGPTAIAATRESEQRQQRVAAAVARLGRPVGEVRLIQFDVQRTYQPARQSASGPFEATASLLVPDLAVGDIGLLIDAVLSAGATGINFIMYEADSLAASRSRLLAEALESARTEAAALATAAGGRLGRLLHVSASPREQVSGIRAFRGGSFSRLTPSDVSTAVTVSARWEIER
jgi:uncharacterized protein YggE